jgi:hypothetical protein
MWSIPRLQSEDQCKMLVSLRLEYVALSSSLFIPLYHNFAFTTYPEIIFCGTVCGMWGSRSTGTIFWKAMPHNMVEFHCHFIEMYHLDLQGWTVKPSRQKVDSHHSACCLFVSLFNPEDGSMMFLQNGTKTCTTLHGETPQKIITLYIIVVWNSSKSYDASPSSHLFWSSFVLNS